MLGLRQEVGSHEGGIALGVGNDTHLGRTRRHVDGHVVEAHLLLGCHHILVARTENLIHLRHALRSVGHGADGLHATNLENLVHTSNAGSHQDGGVHAAFAVGRGAQHNLPASGNLGRSGEHENRREQRGGATGDVETHLLDGRALLPAYDARSRLNLLPLEPLLGVELRDVPMSQTQGVLQLVADQRLGFQHLRLAHRQRLQRHVVELLLVLLDRHVAMLAYVGQHRFDNGIQLRHVEMRPLHDVGPLRWLGVFDDSHYLFDDFSSI